MIFEINERRVIPNWRDFKRTWQLGELNSSLRATNKPLNFNLERAVSDWKTNSNIGNAADLVNSAYVSGLKSSQDVLDAVEFIRANRDQASASLLDLANSFFAEEKSNSQKSLLELDIETVEEFKAFIDKKTLPKLIHKTRIKAHNEFNNPIVWVELARLHSIVGQEEKAEKAISVALNLAPDNRFVLRSATRLFIHNEKFDKALYFLKKSPRTKSDPWLTSAHIATSSIMGRFSTLINSGKSLVIGGNFSSYDLTELSSTLATLELKDGSFKKAKPFIEKATLDPNDNSLAQLEWLSKEDNRIIIDPQSFTNVINPFEAFALDHFQKGNWKEAFNNCLKWFLDIPYSKRPVQLGAYIVGSLLDDNETALFLLKAGMNANPFDPILLNNLTYYHVISNLMDEAIHYFNSLKNIDFHSLSDENKITVQATFGLVAFRSGQIDIGESFYEQSIRSAELLKNDHMRISAILNYTRELIIVKSPKKDHYIDLIDKMEIDDDFNDLITIRKKILGFSNDYHFVEHSDKQ
ncbi:tetratricopeptide repeat protein [Taibaiella helva]|uniref:hypothetical protein n=1 Tax=Taibaiella helva TaxID=2301235 RepID=UPI000E583152|nr:hypothetical protein [Taibaiella helva]